MLYNLSKHLFDFRIFKTIRFFDDSIYNNKIDANEGNQ